MKLPYSDIRAHIYGGRERGLMVIGSSPALRSLAEQILAGVSGAKDVETEAWPRQVASISIPSAPSEQNPYIVSFHVETNSGLPPTNVERNAKPFYLSVVLYGFALVGAITIFRWVAAHVF
jgi:hypothetical protein